MPTEGRRRPALAGAAWAWAAGALALLVLLVLGWFRARAPEPRPPPPLPAAPAAGLRFFAPLPAPDVPQDAAARRRALRDQLRLAEHTYCSYLVHTRYPHTSRPAAHHPDLLYPNQPVLEAHPMRLEGGASDGAVMLRTAQSRVYLAAGESVRFSLHAQDGQGRALALVVTRALAQGVSYGGVRTAPRVTLDFTDGGDGAWSAVLAPGAGPLAGFHGTIRTEVRYSAGGRQGIVLFDVIHSPLLPARWTGQDGEALAGDALRFTLGLAVSEPGRYVVSGRVDDAHGRPFALATFNQVLGAGEQAVTLEVFGKLLHDGAPALPLRLRDVEGHLLREDRDPDRLLLARREGTVFDSAMRSLDGVPNVAWQSEERSRYLAEYAKDRLQARARLRADDPQRDLPAPACALAAGR